MVSTEACEDAIERQEKRRAKAGTHATRFTKYPAKLPGLLSFSPVATCFSHFNDSQPVSTSQCKVTSFYLPLDRILCHLFCVSIQWMTQLSCDGKTEFISQSEFTFTTKLFVAAV